MVEGTSTVSAAEAPAFRVEGLSKRFGALAALTDVTFSVGVGEIRALMGANGSGKSTLVKVATGNYHPDAGAIQLGEFSTDGWRSPLEARRSGIAVVHQEAPLIGNMTVLDMVSLHRGYSLSAYGRISWRKTRESVRKRLEAFGLEIDIAALCATLSDANRSLVALALSLDGSTNRLLVLDEATAAIPQDESDALLERVKELANNGTPVLMVTHRIPEVRKYASHVAVLAGGRLVYDGPTASVSDEELVELMVVGRRRAGSERQVGAGGTSAVDRATPPGDHAAAVAEIRGLRGGRDLQELTMSVRRGEVVGLCGLPDSGVLDVPGLLAGEVRPAAGEVMIDGKALPSRFGPGEAIATGIALVPRDRSRDGGVRYLSIRENMTLPVCGDFWHKSRAERARTASMIEMLDIRPPTEGTLFASLSGGNQQKVVLAKWLLTKPRLLILDDPTYGVDPGSRLILFEEVARRVALGEFSVLMLSTEPELLARHCSRVLAFRGGRVVAELAGSELTEESVAICSAT